jgi:RecG-like helicase
MTKLTKQQIIEEAKAVKSIMRPVMSATNTMFPIKEKFDNFFTKLLSFLQDENEEEGKENKSLYNNIPSADRNLEFLLTKFTKEPTDMQKETATSIQESLEDLFGKEIRTNFIKKK